MQEKEVADKVDLLVQGIALKRFQSHSRFADIEVTKLEVPDPGIGGRWMALILIAGKSIRITFKVHFHEYVTRIVAANLYGKKPETLTVHQILDFIKEFCNLTAGGVKTQFETSNLTVGISLPLATRGFDDVFFPVPNQETGFGTSWLLTVPSGQFKCSTFIEVMDPKALDNVSFEVVEKADDGEVEFL
ncbi:MAG: chemotaxis protein CheX [Pseudobdellovibrionaceae bacterium]